MSISFQSPPGKSCAQIQAAWSSEQKLIAIAQIKSEIFDRTGILVDPKVNRAGIIGNFQSIGAFRINPKMCGPIAAMFATIDLEIWVGMHEDSSRLYFRLAYSYTHSNGGSNGYSVNFDVEVPTLIEIKY